MSDQHLTEYRVQESMEFLRGLHPKWPARVVAAAARYYQDDRFRHADLMTAIGHRWAKTVIGWR
jgi:hypothetical protein